MSRLKTIIRVDADGFILEPWEDGGRAYVRCLVPGVGWELHAVEHAPAHARRARCLRCEERRRGASRMTARAVVRRASERGQTAREGV